MPVDGNEQRAPLVYLGFCTPPGQETCGRDPTDLCVCRRVFFPSVLLRIQIWQVQTSDGCRSSKASCPNVKTGLHLIVTPGSQTDVQIARFDSPCWWLRGACCCWSLRIKVAVVAGSCKMYWVWKRNGVYM